MINLEDYVLTNLNIKTGHFVVRLKDNKQYVVNKNKDGYFIEKDNECLFLSKEVLRAYLSSVREYQVSGI